jgi:hypothetical protein
MRLFRSTGRGYAQRPYPRWRISVPIEVIEQLGWGHRDDLDYTIVEGELRLRRRPERDRRRDHFPGGRYDPNTGALRSELGLRE